MTEVTPIAASPSLGSPLAPQAIKAQSALVAREVGRLRAAAGALPPTGLILASMLSVQVGAALAKTLFATLGPAGTVSVRIVVAALVLLAVERPRLGGQTRADYLAVALFGLVIAGMNLAFYSAIARLPLGLAVTVEFVGPLGVAVAGSRRRLDLLWVGLAAAGILLLAPIGPSSLDSLGVGFALLAGGGWAAYILLNVRVGRAFPGGTGLALSMAVAGLAIVPVGVPAVGAVRAHPPLLLAGVGVALLSTVLPFSLEHAALKRVPAHVFGVLMSAEPAIAALIGAALLGEALGSRGLLALACVVLATAGSARFGRHDGRG
jgi:inner membrane transporter RhtA